MVRFLGSIIFVFAVAVLFKLAAPAVVFAINQDGAAMILPVDPAALVIMTNMGEQRFSIEIADNDRQRSAGLMFRNQMNDDHGMLFVFENTSHLAFWMKNTPMPLDLLFIGADGHIVSISRGEPYSLASIASQAPARFVLELKAGTAEKAGIADGDRVRHPRIDQVAGAH